jgi:hypothetical protein
VGLFSSFFVSVSAQADPPTGVDTTNSSDSASLEILMGSVVGGSSRNTISEVNTANWVWIDGTSDLTTLLTSSRWATVTPTQLLPCIASATGSTKASSERLRGFPLDCGQESRIARSTWSFR